MFRNTFTSTDNQVLANSSIDFYTHVQDQMKVDIGLDAIGYLWTMSEGQISAAEPHLKKMAGNGVEFNRLEGTELADALPGFVTRPSSEQARLMNLEEIRGAIFGPKCGRRWQDQQGYAAGSASASWPCCWATSRFRQSLTH